MMLRTVNNRTLCDEWRKTETKIKCEAITKYLLQKIKYKTKKVANWKKRRKKVEYVKSALHTNFPVENDESIMLESSLPLMIIVLSIADVTQLTAAMCSLQRQRKKKPENFIACNWSKCELWMWSVLKTIGTNSCYDAQNNNRGKIIKVCTSISKLNGSDKETNKKSSVSKWMLDGI